MSRRVNAQMQFRCIELRCGLRRWWCFFYSKKEHRPCLCGFGKGANCRESFAKGKSDLRSLVVAGRARWHSCHSSIRRWGEDNVCGALHRVQSGSHTATQRGWVSMETERAGSLLVVAWFPREWVNSTVHPTRPSLQVNEMSTADMRVRMAMSMCSPVAVRSSKNREHPRRKCVALNAFVGMQKI